MEIQQQQSGNALTFIIKGEIDKETSPMLEENIVAVLNDFENLILDFKDVAYISSACLRVLLSVQKKINALEKTMKIINCNSTIKEIFSMSGFLKYLTVE